MVARCIRAVAGGVGAIATSMIAPELDDERFTVSRFSTRDGSVSVRANRGSMDNFLTYSATRRSIMTIVEVEF
jgi:hypothetical protein